MENDCDIHWIEIYLVDSAIHLLNNWNQIANWSMYLWVKIYIISLL